MKLVEKNVVYVVACILDGDTGEGFLALSLMKILSENFEVKVAHGKKNSLFNRHKFLRDRIQPIYVFFVCLIFRSLQRKVVLLNYIPVWNFMNGILTRFGVNIGPITGQVSKVGLEPSMREIFFRLHLQLAFIKLNKLLINKKITIWCATPSVYKSLKPSIPNCVFGFPYLNLIYETQIFNSLNSNKEYDIFIYSGPHPIKNNDYMLRFVEFYTKNSDAKVCIVGSNIEQKLPNVDCFDCISQDQFDTSLLNSKVYLSFSHEDAGIVTFKAMAWGLNILLPTNSGIGNEIKHIANSTFTDLDTFDDIALKINFLRENDRFAGDPISEFFRQSKMTSFRSSSIWLSQVEK